VEPEPINILNQRTELIEPVLTSYFFSADFDVDSVFALLSFFDPESLSFDPESFEESPLPSESDFDSDFEADEPFFA